MLEGAGAGAWFVGLLPLPVLPAPVLPEPVFPDPVLPASLLPGVVVGLPPLGGRTTGGTAEVEPPDVGGAAEVVGWGAWVGAGS